VPCNGNDRFEHGNHLAQGKLRKATGEVVRSDDALGQQLQLIGIGVNPLMKLSATQCQSWHALGGQSISIHAPGSTDQRENIWIDVDNTFGAAEQPNGWVIAVRPDKVVMADGAPEDAGRIVDAVAQLLY
jgi:3-(3-hydroxy-phenyl)propionate hydroxylase